MNKNTCLNLDIRCCIFKYKRLLNILFFLLINVSLLPLSLITVNATSYTSDDAISWLKSKEGQAIDYDGAYGAQCVDLVMAYYKYLIGWNVNGNGDDYATNTLPSGWVRTKGGQPQKGDILVYAGGGTKAGHVAIYESDYITWHQNWGGQYVRRITNKHYTAYKTSDGATYWGCIHPDFSGNSTTHTIDSSYRTNFTAYPKAKITAENIYDANHNQISSGSWIGTSDQCTIHEVYTDGCCKVTYPLDSGGTKTVYSKISLFNVSSPRVRYWVSDSEYGDTPSEYKAGNRYYFCYKFYDSISGKNWDEIEDCNYTFNLTFYNPDGSVKYTYNSSSDQSWISSFFSEPGTYTAKIVMSGDYTLEGTRTFTVKENPKKIHSSTNSISLNYDGTKSQTIYLWSSGYYSGKAVWNWSSSNSNIACSWGEWTDDGRLPLTINAMSPGSSMLTISLKDKDTGAVLDSTNISVAVNVNTTAINRNSTNNAVISTGGDMKYFTYTPTTSGKYVIYSTGSDDTKVYLYNADWSELNSNDDGGDSSNFRLEYNLTAGTKYIFGVKYYNSSKTGTISFKFGNIFTITYNANGGSDAPSVQSKDYGTNVTLSNTIPTRSGYTFLGWATSSTATSATYQPDESFTENANTTLYAVWKLGCENEMHSYQYTETNLPTTSATGTLTGTCSKCGGTTTVTLPKLTTTDYDYAIQKEAGCTTSGTGRYTWKTTTYGSFYFDVTLAATGHSYTYKVTKEPTTSATGTLTGTCSKCGGTTTVTLPKLTTTDYNYAILKEAGCITSGTGRYTWKTTTYGSFYFDVTLAATGHSYTYKVTKEPTTSATGTLTGTCSKCGGTTTVTLPKLTTADYDYTILKAAGCTTSGTGRYTWKTTTYGSFCFDVMLPATGHNYSNGSCTYCGTDDPNYVANHPVTGIIIDETLSLTLGETATLIATITPENATNKKLMWSSSDTNIAIVSENGLVTAVGNGMATITATAADGSGVSASCEVTVTTAIMFEDVVIGSYYEQPVQWAVEKGITNGYGNDTIFNPEGTCTRGQIVTFLWRANGSPEPASLENPFTDVPSNEYYYKAVLWAVENGITAGYGSDTIFNPDGACTRAQVATFMWRAAGKPDMSGAVNPFADLEEGSFYYDAVLWAVENGITNGYGSADTFCPDITCTRGQIVTFLYRGMN